MVPALTALRALLDPPPLWIRPYVSLASSVASVKATSVADALNANLGDAHGIRFVSQDELGNEPYESFIYRTWTIPTRDNLHDLFNGLVWLRYPRTKRRLNELQAEQLAQRGVSSTRGSLRDALTLFDENAALLRAPDALVDALQCRDWQRLFLDERAVWRQAELVLFGHALMAKLMQPRKAITAHVWVVHEIADAAIATSLDNKRLESKAFLPMPVLGTPGWCAANEQPEFYADTSVFRPPR